MKKNIESTYVKLGLTIFAAGAALILLFEAINNLDGISSGWSTFYTILSPFVYGLVMAYLLCPVYNASVRRTYALTKDKWKTKKRALRFSRIIGSIIALLTLVGVVGGLFALILPETIRSVVGLIQTMPARVNSLIEWMEGILAGQNNPEIAKAFETVINQMSSTFLDWAENELMPRIGDYMSKTFAGVWFTVKTVMNMLIGVIVCVYFLNSKENFKAQAKKSIMALFSKEHADDIFEFANFTNMQFGGFINGKIIDSFIIGCICAVLMTIIKLPYTVLVSTIVGITNFIPFFGPFIGAIPGTLIILLESPIQALYFVILILGLQQFDGNILGPKILGETSGLASFWVMFAILVFGGLFGFVGMIIGVPTFAVIYYYSAKFIKKRLKRKNMPVDTFEYQDFNKYDVNRKEVM